MISIPPLSHVHLVDQLRISARTRKFLLRSDVQTVDQLCQLSYLDLVRSSGLHQWNAYQVRRELARIGRHLRDEAIPGVMLDTEEFGHVDLGLTIHACLAEDQKDPLKLELIINGNVLMEYDLLEGFRAGAEDCEPANRVAQLRHTALDLRRMAAALDELASEEPAEA
ncbi:hypothetical protein [Duganella sp. LjRoot269]|uniref:hypothetical protein n=1 Tax=Duganella sp. LjRoot269 TaxID=3342305 RepID=UPI003ECC834A